MSGFGFVAGGVAIVLAMAVATAFVAYRWGRSAVAVTADDRAIVIKDKQLQVGADKPDAAMLENKLEDGTL